MSQVDPLSLTLLFKKHKTTVLLMLPPHETITTAQEMLLKALQSRGIKEINGDPVPEEFSDIEFGVTVDKNDLEKGWSKLEIAMPELENSGTSKRGAGKQTSLKAADIRNGQVIAFRFRKPREQSEKDGDLDIDLELEDPGWDVVVPSLDDEEGKPN
ncbi:uncharacterized protein NFIA_035510 [Aspergillus fischeri NRRL 181]|uniref:Uncharacterized protein n=1 Tax=Neosartorya fischeri (strain ATCC 1020 / DSM 3700 / CBS 544.65 / FGSC A1164 / JCM 1740 / NRRL 181 / WB 181) TaxID=331117 RepID=A1CZ13_NEOFI|nr:conserved hypothetical protein [Aspergillus fischeri NRRL 181]EAW23983.1 conserved hypothetical protein [Aspergillus fischeri NRRL 181]KAG2026909.1 hypothetical protein GB937_001701 [Aspergillus fischeri]